MKQYSVTGMSCAACQARVEKAVRAVPGVQECAVSLLTNSMGVEGTAEPGAVIAAVQAAGYGAQLREREQSARNPKAEEEALEDHETPKLVRRLLWSAGFLLALMYLSMGHMMWGWPVPAFLRGNHVAMGMAEMLLAGIVMVINQRFFISGTTSLLHGAPNMDTLVSMGSAAAFGYSTCALFAMTGAQLTGGESAAAAYMNELYFESAAMILTLITVGKTLEARSKGRTTDALRGLMKLAPRTATIVRKDTEVTVDAAEIRPGDIFLVRPGESIPADGTVLEGSSAVNEAALTGESVPADKEAGDHVSAATVNQSGFLRCRADRVGEDTTLSQIIRMVEEAAATKAPIAKIADRVSGIFVPTVIAIAVVTTAVWLLLGRGTGFALARGISVLVISCPCALGLATPVAIMVGSGVGAKNGILFKTAAALEETGRVQIAVLDKTGTITSGEPRVTDVRPAPGVSEEELLRMAAALERRSEHPLARAVLSCARERGLGDEAGETTDFGVFPGNGLRGTLDGHALCGGSERFIREHCELPEDLRQEARTLAEQGKTPLYFARDGRLLGLIAAADVLREDSAQAVRELQNMGLAVVMLTGDNERTARAVGAQAGVDRVIAGVLPDGKESVIRELQKSGRVAMVGDGINDAPALTRADVGIAIGAGTDVAIDAADVVLMKSRASDIPAAIRLSRAVLRGIHQNLFWAFFYNAIGIPLAAGVFIPLGLTLNPMFGAAAMSLSSFCVVTNALRLNLTKIYDPAHDRKKREPIRIADYTDHSEKEKESMKKTMKIEGMMCPHCEAAVKSALEALPFVEEAQVSHKAGTAVVTLKDRGADAELRRAVEDRGYKVLGIE